MGCHGRVLSIHWASAYVECQRSPSLRTYGTHTKLVLLHIFLPGDIKETGIKLKPRCRRNDT